MKFFLAGSLVFRKLLPAHQGLKLTTGQAKSNLYQFVDPATMGDLEPLFTEMQEKVSDQNAADLLATFEKLNDLHEGEADKNFYSFSAANDDKNKPRNRYVNILPFDGTRVKLLNVEANESDYINADYVQFKTEGKECPKYISTQGPLPETSHHFWQMAWEQDVQVIVMLTNVVELGRVKCDQYWPNKGSSKEYGKVKVTNKKETPELAYMNRELELQWLSDPSKPPRTITHLQYTAWPDHGVPSTPDEFDAFRNVVRTIHNKNFNKPAIVHCSAGCGRTGAFCAIDTAIFLAQNKLYLKGDLVHTVIKNFRLQRVGMVQTLGQFRFCYVAVLSALKAAPTAPSS